LFRISLFVLVKILNNFAIIWKREFFSIRTGRKHKIRTCISSLHAFKITIVFSRIGILRSVYYWDRERILAERAVLHPSSLIWTAFLQVLQSTYTTSSSSVGINFIESADTNTNFTCQTCVELHCIDTISNSLCSNLLPNLQLFLKSKNRGCRAENDRGYQA
jgi:hypothetical protein